MRTKLVALLLFFACALHVAFARAQAPVPQARPGGGAIVLRVPGRDHGPLELTQKEGGYAGELLVENHGTEPLGVSRIAIRGDDDDLRAPAKLTVRFAEGGTSVASIPPQGVRKVIVQWLPDREPRMKQVFCHVVVTSSDEKSGEVAMGVVARLKKPLPWITDHVLSWLVFLPLVGAALVFGAHLSGRGGGRLVPRLAVGVAVAQCVLAIYAYAAFHPDATRLDGNDGLQMIEHFVWVRPLSAEYFVGVDGVNVLMVLAIPLVSLVALLSAAGGDRPNGFFAMLLVAEASLLGVALAQDLLLLFCFWQATIVSMACLVGFWGTGDTRASAAFKLALVATAGSVLLLVALLALRGHADRTLLVDGSQVTTTFSIPELGRVAFNAKKLTMFGLPFVKVVWVALFLGFGTLLPIFPLHAWLADACEAAPAPASVLLGGGMLPLGAYGMLRVCFPILPDATRWAAGAVVGLGVVSVLYGALAAMGQRDLKRVVAYVAMSHMGFALVGLGSLTPQGIAACVTQSFTHALSVALLFVSIDVLEQRVGTRDATRFGGLAREMPVFSTVLGVALLCSMGAPGLAGFWGELLAVLGAFPSHRALAIVAAASTVVVAASHLWTLERVLLGRLDERWRRDPHLEPHGGKFPDLTSRELATLAPLAALVVVLGLWPTPMLGTIAGGVRDATTHVNPPGPDQIARAERAEQKLALLSR